MEIPPTTFTFVAKQASVMIENNVYMGVNAPIVQRLSKWRKYCLGTGEDLENPSYSDEIGWDVGALL